MPNCRQSIWKTDVSLVISSNQTKKPDPANQVFTRRIYRPYSIEAEAEAEAEIKTSKIQRQLQPATSIPYLTLTPTCAYICIHLDPNVSQTPHSHERVKQRSACWVSREINNAYLTRQSCQYAIKQHATSRARYTCITSFATSMTA